MRTLGIIGVAAVLYIFLISGPATGATQIPDTADSDDDEVQFGDWQVSYTDDKNWILAITINDSGNSFGKICQLSKGKCYWTFTASFPCKIGDTGFPLLANANEDGAASVDVVCSGKTGDDSYRYIFTNWKAIESLIQKSTRIGFAVPMQSDNFTVVRFSLDGMAKSIENIEKVALDVKSKSTENEVL